jgi:hypothetical protein
LGWKVWSEAWLVGFVGEVLLGESSARGCFSGESIAA